MRLFLALLATLALLGASPAVAADDKPFGGVGLQVVPTITGELVVLQVLANAPAAEEGLRAGDLIYRVGDFELRGSDFGKVISEHLWGPVGSSVELHYRRPGVAGDRRVTLRRSAIDPRLTATPSLKDGSAVKKGAP